MVVEGEQVVVGDVDTFVPEPDAGRTGPTGQATVGYEILCRRHHMRRMTAHTASLLAGTDQPLPFEGGTGPLTVRRR